MSERFKYSENGVYRCENFAQQLAQNTFPTVQLGTIGGIDGWYIKLEVVENGTIVYPFIHSYDKPQLHIYYYFNIRGKGRKSFFTLVNETNLKQPAGPGGYMMNILDVLNDKNGYLNNGALVIEYGIHINGILGDDGIWKFNFNDSLFNHYHDLTIFYGHPEVRPLTSLHAPKQILTFHSVCCQHKSIIIFDTFPIGKKQVKKCLQMAHGVRVQLDKNCLDILSIAHSNRLRNVVQYADQQLVNRWNPKKKLSDILVFENCIQFGLRHMLAHLINRFESLEDIKTIIQKLDIQKMSGEVMKTFMAKIFKLRT